MFVNRKVAKATTLAISIAGALLVAFAWNSAGTGAPSLASSPGIEEDIAPQPLKPEKHAELLPAIEAGWIQVGFRGDGVELLFGKFRNELAEPLELIIPEGLVLETPESSEIQGQIILVRRATIVLEAGQEVDERLYCAATNSGNRHGDYVFQPTSTRLPLVEPVLNHLRVNPAFSHGAIQTAVLSVTENLPMGFFAKFTLASETPPSLQEAGDFRVDVRDLIAALQLLRDAGVPEDQLALAVDPQLKIEAMCDRLTHAQAMKYYGITKGQEWEFWHNELLKGDPSTRHYALYGIARYFPDVAVDMMPKWARSERLNSVFRISSIIAIAETRRPEALSVLAQLNYEFSSAPEMRRATEEAARYLENYVNPPDRRPANIEWQLVQTMKMLTGGQ